METSRKVILCDEQGKALDLADIEQAHSGQGSLHVAFSVYVFRNDDRELLIQQRSINKRLWPRIWANTCCSHPQDGEDIISAGMCRLQEECGFTCPLWEVDAFVYRAEDPAGRGVEHEYDRLLVGRLTEAVEVAPNPNEIADWKWIEVDELSAELAANPTKFAPWFATGFGRVVDKISGNV